MTKKLLFLAILLLCMQFAFATNITFKPVVDQISPYDAASFEVTLYNDKAADRYAISHQDVMWSITMQPITDYTSGVDVNSSSSKTTMLYIKPRDTISFGRHDVEIAFTSKNTGEVVKQVVTAYVREDLIKYPFDVTVNADIPVIMSPKRTNSVKVALKNNNKLDVGDFDITLKSDLIDKKSTVTLNSSQEKVIDFSVSFDPQIKPRADTLTIQVMHNGSLVKEFKQEFSISGYGNFIREESKEKKGLVETSKITFTNNGTVESESEFEFAVSGFDRYFTNTVPKMTLAKFGDGYQYLATVRLGPGKTTTIQIVKSYRPLAYLAIVLIIILVVWLAFKNPIVLKKSVKNVEMAEGGISRVRVILRIKNRSSRMIKNIEIIDKIPSICMLERRSEETLKPSKVFQFPGGTAISWNLHHLDPKEEILLDYELKTKLRVVGDFQLKPFIARHGSKKSASNVVDVYAP